MMRLHDLGEVAAEFDVDLRSKRTMHIAIPREATDEETERFEQSVVDVAYGFRFEAPCDAFVSSHGGDCDDDPHCGAANPWRQRALAAEARLREIAGTA